MEIKTIDNTVVETDKLSDIQAQMIELVEKSGIRDFVAKHDGFCYLSIGIPNQPGWETMHLNNRKKIDMFLKNVNNLFVKMSDNKFRLAVVPTRAIKEIIFEDEKL